MKYLFLVCVVAVLAGCGDGKKEPSAEMLKSPMYKARQELIRPVTFYLDMKDALIQGDAPLAGEAASLMMESLEKGDLFSIEQLEITNVVHLRQETRIARNQVGLDSLRASFSRISAALVPILLETGAPEYTLYVLHCPMAIGEGGARWVSREKKVENPYFGEEMLHCGSVEGMIGTREY